MADGDDDSSRPTHRKEPRFSILLDDEALRDVKPEEARGAVEMLRWVIADTGVRSALMNSLTPMGRSNLTADLDFAGFFPVARREPAVTHYGTTPEPSAPSHPTSVKGGANPQKDARRRKEALEWLARFVNEHRIVEDLCLVAIEQKASTDAYQRVIGDLQRKLDEAYAEVGRIDPINRNRKEFMRLLEETFSLKVGPVSVNLRGLMKICRFAFRK